MQFIQNFKRKRQLRKLKSEYVNECQDLVCYCEWLKFAIKKEQDDLSTTLRKVIADSRAKCVTLSGKIKVLESWLRKNKEHNTVMTTG